MFIITTHVPSSSISTFTNISTLWRTKPKTAFPILLGDFNAHIGSADAKACKNLVGHVLHHQKSNMNGESLLSFITEHNIRINSTWGRNSCRVTWQINNMKSQLDHIMSDTKKPLYFGAIKGIWPRKVATDHKIIWARILNSSFINTAKKNKTRTLLSQIKDMKKPFNFRNYNYENLQTNEIGTKFKLLVNEKLEEKLKHAEYTQGIDWKDLNNILKDSTQNLLTAKTIRKTSECRKAMAKVQQLLFKKNRNPRNLSLNNQLKGARRELRLIQEKENEDNCKKFFAGLGHCHKSLRMKVTYKFIRKLRQSNSRAQKKTFIPIHKWLEELKKSAGPWIETVAEKNEYIPRVSLNPETINSIIGNLRNRTAPGTNQIVPELYKAAPESFVNQLTIVMKEAWIHNTIPDAWLHTMQVPIPKKPNPKSISDYRRISVCNVGYRIYANYLLQVLDAEIGPLGNYQAAFLTKRSTDDHIFVVKRILEEEWRAGRRTYVVALDLEKAFDTVDLAALRDILLTRTNTFLTNRIIRACMHEKTFIAWCGQNSEMINKAKGVKQGCPLSPRLFTLVMDEVLKTLEEEEPSFKLDQDHDFELPIVLSFADDIIIIGGDLITLDSVISKLKVLLKSVGLKLNDTKTKLVVRDPDRTRNRHELPVSLAGTLIHPLDEIKYLGTYITSGIQRRMTIKKRGIQAIKNAKLLVPFIKTNRLDWKITRLIYKMVISPTMTYGLNVSALTKANRSRLRRYERQILREMLEVSKDPPRGKIRQVLEGKTASQIVKVRRICYFGHILRRTMPHLLKTALQYENNKKKIGRPIYTWKSSLQHDVRYSDFSLEHFKAIAQDKNVVKRDAETIYKNEETDTESDNS